MCFFFLALLIAVVSIPAAHFDFCLFLFVLFVLFVVGLSGEPKQNQKRGLVDCKLVQAPSNFIAGRPKVALLFWFFVGFRCSVWLCFVILVRYKN